MDLSHLEDQWSGLMDGGALEYFIDKKGWVETTVTGKDL